MQEDATVDLLMDVGELGVSRDVIQRQLDEGLPAFVARSEEDNPRYRLYHASLREFVSGQAEKGRLSDGDQRLLDELGRATRAAHGQIANRYLVAWGQLEQGLPGLQQESLRQMDGGYGLRHLTSHLEAARRVEEIHTLLASEREESRRIMIPRHGLGGWFDRVRGKARMREDISRTPVWYEAREEEGDTDGFLQDVERAWRLAEAPLAQGPTIVYPGIARQCRYGLLQASINSMAHNIPPQLLQALVKAHVWSPAQALTYVAQSGNQIASSLTQVLPCLPSDLILRAVEIAHRIDDVEDRALGLAAQHLPAPAQDDVLHEALQLASPSDDDGKIARVLWAVEQHLPASAQDDVLHEMLQLANTIRDAGGRAAALAGVVEAQVAAGRVDAAFEVAKTINNSPRQRAQALAAVAQHLPVVEQDDVLHEALQLTTTIDDARQRATPLMAVVHALVTAGRVEAALQVAKMIDDAGGRAAALAAVEVHLPAPARLAILREVLQLSYTVDDEEGDHVIHEQSAAGHVVVKAQLAAGHVEAALEVAKTIFDNGERVLLLASVAQHLPVAKQGAVFYLAGRTAKKIHNDGKRALALVAVVKAQAAVGRVEAALQLAKRIKRPEERAQTLAAVARHLPAAEQGFVLHEALQLANTLKYDH